jgi:omega-6 fatty acid desaturase (delta-12 desaturase)
VPPLPTTTTINSPGIAAPIAEPDGRRWLRVLAPYREPQTSRGLVELAATLVPFVALWVAMLLCLNHDAYWLSLLLAVPAAGFLVRLFMIQHDCGHGSFFRRRTANDWLGRTIGVVTLTPYNCWRRAHAIHHATSGNLEKRGVGDIDTLTVREFRALTPARRFFYRLFRSPLVMLGIGPLYLFVIQHRLPIGAMRSRDAWISAMATNVAIAAVAGLLVILVGWREFLLIQVPITWLAASIGVWLFYIQHQFEHAYWEQDDAWSAHDGALRGSSHFDLPPVLRWLTADIGVHHVHHLSSRIPSYRLGEVLRDHPELREVNRLTLRDAVSCFGLALWDEEQRRMVSFREATAAHAG